MEKTQHLESFSDQYNPSPTAKKKAGGGEFGGGGATGRW
jgi:uncharacterized membrane protein YgcG